MQKHAKLEEMWHNTVSHSNPVTKKTRTKKGYASNSISAFRLNRHITFINTGSVRQN